MNNKDKGRETAEGAAVAATAPTAVAYRFIYGSSFKGNVHKL